MLSMRATSTLSTASPLPFIAAVTQNATTVPFPILWTPPFPSSRSVRGGVTPSAGSSTSPSRKDSRGRTHASGSTCTIERLSGCFRFTNSAMSVMSFSLRFQFAHPIRASAHGPARHRPEHARGGPIGNSLKSSSFSPRMSHLRHGGWVSQTRS
jgi:hypothetical protein